MMFAYERSADVSAFRIGSVDTAQKADGFSADLCVLNEDIGTLTSGIDMSRATAAALFDLNNLTPLYAKNVHERLYPASLTKVMTAIVAVKYGDPDALIKVTEDVTITESGATLCGLEPGDMLTLNQALHALLINSANDAAIAIAVHIGGSVEGFCDMMNKEAAAIGATNSHFMNPHGLSQENHYVTAYDMYLIFNEAIQSELFNEIIHMTSYSTVYHDSEGDTKEMSFQTTNQYLNGTSRPPENVTVTGGKTGTTNAAKNCLVLLAKDAAGNPYISVILRSDERGIMYQEMTQLLELTG